MDESSRSDAELIQSVLEFNRQDYKILMERYHQKIFAYLFRFLNRNEQAALDLTQDVFIRMYENLRSFDTSRPLQPWIYRIAHNQAANYLRTLSRRKESNLKDEYWDTFSKGDHEPSIESEETRQMVLEALDQVEARYREVLVLYFFEEKSYKEIAEIIDSSTNTVGTFVSRGKKQLKQILEPVFGPTDLMMQMVFTYLLCFFSPTAKYRHKLEDRDETD